VTQASLPFAGGAAANRVDELLLYCDGGARGNPGPAAIGAVVFDATVDPPQLLVSVSERIGIATNNVAEYKALIAGLEAVTHLQGRIIRVRADSLLVINQLLGRWKVKHENMRPLHARARTLLAAYDVVDLQHVPREENAAADALVNAALDAS
jgi:ribonuclease HI